MPDMRELIQLIGRSKNASDHASRCLWVASFDVGVNCI